MPSLALTVLALLLMPVGTVLAGERLRLAYSDVENFPNQMGNGQTMASPPGLAVDLIREAAHELGIELDFVRMPAIRLLISSKNGEIDGAFIFSFKEDRLQYGAYPMRDGKPDRQRRITTINYSFFVRHDASISWDGKQLGAEGEPVGINYTFSIGDDLRKMGLRVDDSGRSATQNIGKLRGGRIASYATLEDSGDMFLKRNNVSDVIKLAPPITSRDYYLILSHQFLAAHGELATRLWNKIGQLREKRSGALLEKYAN